MTNLLITQVLNGITNGLIFALITLGLSIVLGLMCVFRTKVTDVSGGT